MKHKIGTVLIILGCGFVAAALVLFLHNQQEQLRAAAASQEAIEKVVEAIRIQRNSEASAESADPTAPQLPTAVQEPAMHVVEIDGHGYIGFLGIPALGLELPVMADWSYSQLQIAPCRYSGSLFSDDLVIMAHNYPRHFGKLKDLQDGAAVSFTNMDGDTVTYQVMALEILGATAVEEITSGDYDLTLFTCTYGGENRVTIRCDRTEN